MKKVELARILFENTNWNVSGIAFLLDVPREAIAGLAKEDGDPRAELEHEDWKTHSTNF